MIRAAAAEAVDAKKVILSNQCLLMRKRRRTKKESNVCGNEMKF